MEKYQYVAPCLMGVEKFLANELKYMDAQNVRTENGRVFFEGGAEIMVRANIRSRIAERVLIVCARFSAESFEELFNGVRSVDWKEYIPLGGCFPVTGSCLSSKLKSVPDCQSIIKKAIAQSLTDSYGVRGMLPESGSMYKVRFLILKDNACIMLDTTGEPLHKRGYRALSNDAPMKETLAASLTELARVRSTSTVIDPCCGSGTILIEAALRALNIPAGMKRSFASEEWGIVPTQIWDNERSLAQSLVRIDCGFRAVGYDIDENALEVARHNAIKAGVGDYIQFKKRDIRDFEESFDSAIVICNPPYGERLLDITQAEELYAVMGERFVQKDGWSYTVICPDDDFERFFRRRANKRRKLYNGMISCQVYQYFGAQTRSGR